MPATRREFLKTTMIAGAGMALPGHALASLQASNEAQAAASPQAAAGTEYTRGLGVYPGLPSEGFCPLLIPDTSGTYRNLALLRPAFHSSSYDYNLTAQLITDGIKDSHSPNWIACTVNGEFLPKETRETLLDHHPANVLELPGATPSVEIHLGGGTTVPEIDRIGLFVVVPEYVDPTILTFTVLVSDDGHTWKQMGSGKSSPPLAPDNYPPDLAQGAHLLAPSIPLNAPVSSRYFRVEFGTAPDTGAPERPFSVQWRCGQVEFYRGTQRIEVGGPYRFTSAWKSAGLDEEWVHVDLGARSTFDRITLHWIACPAEGKLQVSDDAQKWNDLQSLPNGTDAVDDIHLAQPAQGRYVRALLTRPASADGYILSEMEVFGRGGLIAKPVVPVDVVEEAGKLDLGHSAWKLQRIRSDAAAAAGETISAAGFKDADWLIATVPGTTLTSYLNLGAIPDPNFGQNQLHISDSYFYADFWYRTEFTAPALRRDELAWLNLDGINWKAEVFLNGAKLGDVDGGFMRGRFNVTDKLLSSKPNALAIRVLKNATPGSCKQKTFETTGKNGGGLGADNPTYHASIGWDWIPTIRGRNTGIWGDVTLTTTGAVTLEDPLVISTLPLPDTSRADVALEVFAVNHSGKPVSSTLRGRFGEIDFEQRVDLAANERKVLKLSPATHPQLRLQNPSLWWPAGYGDAHLYDVELTLQSRGRTLDRQSFKAGVRRMTASEEGGALRLWINGRRFIARGGNWGFGESMLRYRAREYDTAARYHREMNFTMVRNWVGQIGDDAFFEACDRNGIVVWQDFWLANPWDGPVPDDNAMFLANARDFLSRIRRHASIGLYCGRNEWFPPAPLEKGLRALLAELHPDIHYIGSSADGPVSGHGPYRAMTPPFYFHTADAKLHSELGAPNIPTLDSVRLMMPERALWPQALDWGLHDFTLEGAQGGAQFRTLIDESYGGATNAEDWISLAQFLNYDTYRAMFEAQSQHRMGLLLWMSHPCWPSFVWQTYDYYFDPTAAYFGCKKASEPIHIQWNSFAETIEVVNYNAGNVANLTAEIEVLNLDGTSRMKRTISLDSSKEDSTATVLKMDYPAGLSAVHFLRLTLRQNGTVRSSNFYLRGVDQGDYRAIRSLPKAGVRANTKVEQHEVGWLLTTELRNTSSVPALMVRAKAVRGTTRDRILPALYDDNYIALMPNETRTLRTELKQADTRGEKPLIELSGFNLDIS